MNAKYGRLKYHQCHALLEDYLLIKYPSEEAEHREIIGKLLNQYPLESSEIHVIDGIIINEILMIIKNDQTQKVEHVYILDSSTREKKFYPYIFNGYKMIAK